MVVMSIKNKMLMDQLKGHSYKMSPFQWMEVQSHYDPELQWILASTVENFSKTLTGNTYNVRHLFNEVAKAVVNVIAEREQAKNIPSYNSITDVMLEAYYSYTGAKAVGQYNTAELFLIYAIDAAIIQIRHANLSK
jgi:hypothetical protein